ncbi:MAG: hypothetical protein ABJA66_17155 [Actinomycetota bacterium]
MSEKLVIKNLGFSTADAENIETFFFNGSTLWLKFFDWREQVWRVEFSEVVAFSWNQEEVEHQELRDDCVYEVKDSDWLGKYRKIGTIGIIDKYKHYKFCFNAYGILDVIFEEMKVINDK